MAFYTRPRPGGPQRDSTHGTIKAAFRPRFPGPLACFSLVMVVIVQTCLQPSEAEPESKASAVLRSGRAPVNSLAWAPDGTTLAAAMLDGQVVLWDTARGRVKAVFSLPGVPDPACKWDPPGSLAWAPNGRTLALCRGGEVILRDVAEGRTRGSLRVASPPIRSLAFSPDGADLAVGCGDGEVILWDLGTDRIRATLRGNKGSLNGLVFSPDGRTLASFSSDGTLCAWDAATGRLQWAVTSPNGGTSVAFAPDGATIATSGAYLTVRDSASGRALCDLERVTSQFNGISYSPGGQWLAAITFPRGRVILWESTGLRRRACFQGLIAPGYSLAFSPNGWILAAGGQDGMVELWPVAEVIGKESSPPDDPKDESVGRVHLASGQEP